VEEIEKASELLFGGELFVDKIGGVFGNYFCITSVVDASSDLLS